LGPTMRRLSLAAMLLFCPACGADDADTSETGAHDGGSTAAPVTDGTAAETAATGMTDAGCVDSPQLHVVNDTGNAVEEIVMTACEGLDAYSYPVPPCGLPQRAELTIDLPGPGCWMLSYSGEGCFDDVPGMVEAACVQTVEW